MKARLRSDLERFRVDGSFEDEADPDSGHGWMCRLADSEALGAAGFERVRKSELEPS